MKIILTLLLLAMSLPLKAIEIEKLDENTIRVTTEDLNANEDYVISLRYFEDMFGNPEGLGYAVCTDLTAIPAQAKIDEKNTVVMLGKPRAFTLTGLSPETRYALDVFTKTDKPITLEFTTLAKMPTVQAHSIAFLGVTDNAIGTRFIPGNGKNRIAVVRYGRKPDMPQNGIEYKEDMTIGATGPGEGPSSGNTVVIFNSMQQRSPDMANVDELTPGEYFFAVYEYNGSGESTHYLTKEAAQNPRSTTLGIVAPVALPAKNVKTEGFTAHWEKSPNAEAYIIDVSYDADFGEKIGMYDEANFGNITELPVHIGKAASNTLYYRVRALQKGKASAWSNAVQVTLK